MNVPVRQFEWGDVRGVVEVEMRPGRDLGGGYHAVEWYMREHGDEDEVCVWARIEGIGTIPFACTARGAGFRWAHGLVAHRIADLSIVTGCCRSNGLACSRDLDLGVEQRHLDIIDQACHACGFGPSTDEKANDHDG